MISHSHLTFLGYAMGLDFGPGPLADQEGVEGGLLS